MLNTKLKSAEDWLIAGVELFAREGMQGIQLHRISLKVEASEADFFHYFRNEEEYLREMIRYWRNAKTSKVIETFGRVPVGQRLEKLVDTVFADRSLHDFLFHLRKLGTTDKEVAKTMEDLEQERIDSTRPIFQGLGFGLKEIELKVEILYSFYLGWYERNKNKRFTPALRAEVLEQIRHLLDLN
jgi:AcrR family transcriptional regulator